MTDLRRFERGYRAMLMYASGHTALTIWCILWNYYHGKHAKDSPIQVTPQLRQAVKEALIHE